MTRILVAGYLFAIVLANLAVTEYGPRISVYTAFAFIGLDLTCRDRLHDAWAGHVLRNMAALILAGSLISYVLNRDTARIALASCIAFGAAAAVDAVTYHLLRRREWYERANGSNLAGSATDSALFLPLAFGTFPWAIMFAQFCAKVAGGVVWAFVLRRSPGDEWLERNRRIYARARS